MAVLRAFVTYPAALHSVALRVTWGPAVASGNFGGLARAGREGMSAAGRLRASGSPTNMLRSLVRSRCSFLCGMSDHSASIRCSAETEVMIWPLLGTSGGLDIRYPE